MFTVRHLMFAVSLYTLQLVAGDAVRPQAHRGPYFITKTNQKLHRVEKTINHSAVSDRSTTVTGRASRAFVTTGTTETGRSTRRTTNARSTLGSWRTTEMDRGSPDEYIGMFNEMSRVAYLVIGWLGVLNNGVVFFVLLCNRAERRSFANIIIANQSLIVSGLLFYILYPWYN